MVLNREPKAAQWEEAAKGRSGQEQVCGDGEVQSDQIRKSIQSSRLPLFSLSLCRMKGDKRWEKEEKRDRTDDVSAVESQSSLSRFRSLFLSSLSL
jgi:hypothetical protein